MHMKRTKVAWVNYVENVINMNFELFQRALTSIGTHTQHKCGRRHSVQWPQVTNCHIEQIFSITSSYWTAGLVLYSVQSAARQLCAQALGSYTEIQLVLA